VEDPSLHATGLADAVLHLKRLMPLERTTVDLAASLDLIGMQEGRPQVVWRGAVRLAGVHALAIGARGPHPDRRIRRPWRENVLRNRSAALGATSFDAADEQDDRGGRDPAKQRAERDRSLIALPHRRLAEQHDAGRREPA